LAQGRRGSASIRYALAVETPSWPRRPRGKAFFEGGALLMASLFGAFPVLVKLYADAGYQGPQFQSAMKRILAQVTVEIVKRSDQAKGFVTLPKRWIVERTLAWLGRCRRLAKDWECLNRKALAFLRLASIRPDAAKAMQSRMMFPPAFASRPSA
jgi:transposase